MTNTQGKTTLDALTTARDRMRQASEARDSAYDRAKEAIRGRNAVMDPTAPDWDPHRAMAADEQMHAHGPACDRALETYKTARADYEKVRTAYLAEGGFIQRLIKRVQLIGK